MSEYSLPSQTDKNEREEFVLPPKSVLSHLCTPPLGINKENMEKETVRARRGVPWDTRTFCISYYSYKMKLVWE